MEIDAVEAYIVKDPEDTDEGMDLDDSNRNRDRNNKGIKKGKFSWPSKNPALFSRMKPCKERSYEYVRFKQYIPDCFEACEGSQGVFWIITFRLFLFQWLLMRVKTRGPYLLTRAFAIS